MKIFGSGREPRASEFKRTDTSGSSNTGSSLVSKLKFFENEALKTSPSSRVTSPTSTNDKRSNIATGEKNVMQGDLFLLDKKNREWKKVYCTVNQDLFFTMYASNEKKHVIKTIDLAILTSPYHVLDTNEFNDLVWNEPRFGFQFFIESSSKSDKKDFEWILSATSENIRGNWTSKIQTMLRIKTGTLNPLANNGTWIREFKSSELGQGPQPTSTKKPPVKAPRIDSVYFPDIPYEEIEEEDVNKVVEQTKTMNLDELDLSNLNLHCWPVLIDGPVYTRTPNVSIVDLSFNMLKSLPTDILKLQFVEELIVNGCRLKSFPPNLYQLVYLKDLQLNGNMIDKIPQEIGYLTGLQKLKLNNNHIDKIDDAIGCLRKLKILHLSGNPIGILPTSIGEMKSLQVLDLSYCDLEYITPEITYLENVYDMNLSGNKIKRLPNEFGRLKSLSLLNLERNEITELPASLGYCKFLMSDSKDQINLILNPIVDNRELQTSREIINGLRASHNINENSVPSWQPLKPSIDRYATLPKLTQDGLVKKEKKKKKNDAERKLSMRNRKRSMYIAQREEFLNSQSIEPIVPVDRVHTPNAQTSTNLRRIDSSPNPKMNQPSRNGPGVGTGYHTSTFSPVRRNQPEARVIPDKIDFTQINSPTNQSSESKKNFQQKQLEIEEEQQQKQKISALVTWGLAASSCIFMNIVDLKSKVQDCSEISDFVPLLKTLQSFKSEFSGFSSYINIKPQDTERYEGPDKMKMVKYLIISISDEVLEGLIEIEIWMNQEPTVEQLLEIVPILKYLKGVAEQFQAIEDG